MEPEPPIRLEPLEDSDIARFLALSGDPVLVETMGWDPFEPDEEERFLRYIETITVPHLSGGRTIAFSITDSGSGTPIGYLVIKGFREGGTMAEVGIAIMDKEYRGRGLGTEALKLAAEYAFEELEIAHLVLTVFPSNKAGIRSYEKVGFKQTDVLRESWEMPDGSFSDMTVMELTKPQENS
jgi:RimJ/RimL family protein N-acetyltransferase